jgi:hypothetical protein
MQLKTYLIILILTTTQLLSQTNIFHLQNKNSLIEIGNHLAYSGYKQLTKINDTVNIQQKQCSVTQIVTLLDSLHKVGYKDEVPKNISQSKYQCKLNLIDIAYFSHDTLKNNLIDSVYTIDVEVVFNYPKQKINKTLTYFTLYTHYTKAQLQTLFATYNLYDLNYFKRSNIYMLKIDFSFARFQGKNKSLGLSIQEIDF